MLLEALPGNILQFRNKRFILMLMNPLTVQQSCLYDVNGSGAQRSSCMKPLLHLSHRRIQKAHPWWSKGTFWGASVCTEVSQSWVLCPFFFSMYGGPVDEIGIACSRVHQVASTLPLVICRVRVLPTYCNSKNGPFLTNTQFNLVLPGKACLHNN